MHHHIKAILWKQGKETFKNKEILIQFVMFPVLSIIMENTVKIQGMPEHFFANLFASMYMGMAPLTSMAAVIAEEKEKNTLRVLMMSNVKPAEYLLGVSSYLFGICMLGAAVIGWSGGYRGSQWFVFLILMGMGILVSLMIGAAIGIWSKNQMMATSVTVPVMMIFSFLPMLSIFNSSIEKIAQFTYSGQIYFLINQTEKIVYTGKQAGIIGFNMLAAVLLFQFAYKRCRLD